MDARARNCLVRVHALLHQEPDDSVLMAIQYYLDTYTKLTWDAIPFEPRHDQQLLEWVESRLTV